jgi:Arc/MetJ-type ribon-helix-helix transcriptional regulator
MIAVSDDHLVGATIWQQELFDLLLAHERDEEEVISAYEAFAEEAHSDAVRYLVRLILDDEKRHHRVLSELANTIRADATFEKRGARVPHLDVHHRDDSLLQETDRFLALELKDRAELKHLARKVRTVGGALDAFVVELLQSDTERHIRILHFIKNAVRSSPVR